MNHHQLTSFSNKPQMDAVESMRNVDVCFTAKVVWSLRSQWHHQSYYWKTVSSICVHGNTESEKSACCLRVWESQEVLCVQEWGEWEGKNGWYSHWNSVGVPDSLWGDRWLKPWIQPHNTESFSISSENITMVGQTTHLTKTFSETSSWGHLSSGYQQTETDYC